MTAIIARAPFYLGGARPDLGTVTDLADPHTGHAMPHTLVAPGKIEVPDEEARRLIKSGWCRPLGKEDQA